MNRATWSALLLLSCCYPGRAQGEFWGELKTGRYGVGFRALYQTDAARWYDPDYPVAGKPLVKKPRPILIALWYPANRDQGKMMLQRDYYRALTLDEAAPDFAQRLRKFTRDQDCEFMLGKDFDALTDDERGRWDGLLATPVFAVMDAPAAEGRFPVVIYHPGLGGTFEDNAVACEYLASHGYVVLSSAYQAADSSALEIDGDLETSFADLSFLLRHAATLPFADASTVAAMGHSHGAQAALAWRAQPNSPLDAVVFLDTNVDYAGLDAPQFAKTKAALERSLKSSAPVVMFADRDKHPKFETFDPYLKFAARYEAGATGLEHNDFVSQGAIGKNDAARRSYEAICEVTLKFLDAYLKGDVAALKGLQGAGSGGSLHLRYRPGAPPPATGAQIARLYLSEGSGSSQELSALMKSGDAEAFIGAAAILLEGGEKKQAVTLLRSAARLRPRSAAVAEALGETLQQTGDREGAMTAYEQALALLPGDDTLSDIQKAVLTKAIEDARKR